MTIRLFATAYLLPLPIALWQKAVYHIPDGEGLMELDGEERVVRANDVIFIPPDIVHSLYNTGFANLVFIVVPSPPTDE